VLRVGQFVVGFGGVNVCSVWDNLLSVWGVSFCCL